MSLLSAIRGHIAGRMLLFLVATALQTLLAVAILPLTTIRLTAADFGYFALLTSVTAFANALSDGGGALALPAHYGVASTAERRHMLASFFSVSLVLGATLAGLFLLCWPALSSYVIGADSGAYSWLTEVLAAMLIPLRSVTTLATTVFSVSGRGNAIAAQIAAQAVGNFAGTLICLFGLQIGVTSLFAGAVLGQLASLAVALFALGAQPWTRPTGRWLAVVGRHAPTAAFSGVSDGARGIGENAVLAANLGIASVGFYSHARLYYGMLISATNAVAHNLWSTSLAEARDPGGGFRRTEAAWTPVHIFVALFGVGFVCFGGEFVALLTHDRLTPAASLVPWLAVLLLIHISGRAQNAVAYANGAGAEVSRFRALLALLVLGALPCVVGKIFGIGLALGVSGVIGLLLFEAVVFRFYLRWKSNSFGHPIGFQDQWALAGIVLTISAWLLNAMVPLTLQLRSVIFVGIVFIIAATERKRVNQLLDSLRGLLKSRR